MKLGVRGKLFLISMALILIAGLSSVLYLEYQLRTWQEDDMRAQLLRHARHARLLLLQRNPKLSLARLDSLADLLGKVSSARVTLLAPDGRVLGDSRLPLRRVRTVENHLHRPEVQQALHKGRGVAKRYSTTLNATMLYIAIRDQRQPPLIIRVAMPMKQLEERSRKLRFFLLFAVALGLVVALFMSALASHLMSRALRRLVSNARKIAQDSNARETVQKGGQRIPTHSLANDELGGLVGSFNRIVDEWERLIIVLAEERDRFETILQSMNAAVIALDKHQRITLDNPSALSRLGLSASPRGKTLYEAVHSEELRELANKANAGLPATNEFDLPGPPPRRVLVRATPLQDKAGVVLVIHDITDLRHLENIRKEFVANVSHELRTPISIITANIETLLDGAVEDPKFASRFLESSLRNTKRLSELIDDILDISKIEAGRYDLEYQHTDLTHAIEHAIESVSSAHEKRPQLTTSLPPTLPIEVDPRALDQMLINLLDNAVKYTPEGGNIQVRAFSLEDEAMVRVEIEDDGPGLAPHHRERIFERFYRIDPGRSRQVGGTGLGLAIVKHLAQAMGGLVGVETARPHGSIFWFALPLSPPKAPPSFSSYDSIPAASETDSIPAAAEDDSIPAAAEDDSIPLASESEVSSLSADPADPKTSA